ncbi:unnamed protein product [Psylliodes chrysocephalus]|uniref:Uncharacterized protein n=1 Tax=Psylliodes chrysocephalus TaxID=3402493 RepID=A0A9P0CNW2_9CUCU|nr:unnamed protein product [Psylliodes chrysocephala]
MKKDKHSNSRKIKSRDSFNKETRDHSEPDEDTSDSEKGYVTIKKRILPLRATRNNSNKNNKIEAIASIKLDKADSELDKATSESVETDSETVKADRKSEITDSIPKVRKLRKKSKVLSKKKCKKRIRKPIKPVGIVNEFKLKKMLKSIDGKRELNDSQMEFKKCLAQMHPSFEPLWIGRPYFIMKAIKECLLNRDWDSLTHLLIDLVHLKSNIFKPVVRHLCAIMDKLHPIIIENDLQGKFKTIKKYHQMIMDDTTVV